MDLLTDPFKYLVDSWFNRQTRIVVSSSASCNLNSSMININATSSTSLPTEKRHIYFSLDDNQVHAVDDKETYMRKNPDW
eukprot:Awhi_evm1s9913